MIVARYYGLKLVVCMSVWVNEMVFMQQQQLQVMDSLFEWDLFLKPNNFFFMWLVAKISLIWLFFSYRYAEIVMVAT